jgi:hypothetical protein
MGSRFLPYPLELRVDLGAGHQREAREVEPEEDDRHRGQAPVEHSIMRHRPNVRAEDPRHGDPQHMRDDRPRPHATTNARGMADGDPVEDRERTARDRGEGEEDADALPPRSEETARLPDDEREARGIVERRGHAADQKQHPRGERRHHEQSAEPRHREQALPPPRTRGRVDEELEDVHQVVDAVRREPQEADEAEGCDRLQSRGRDLVELGAEEVRGHARHRAVEGGDERLGRLALHDVPREEAGAQDERDEPQEEVERHRRRMIERVMLEEPSRDGPGQKDRTPLQELRECIRRRRGHEATRGALSRRARRRCRSPRRRATSGASSRRRWPARRSPQRGSRP